MKPIYTTMRLIFSISTVFLLLCAAACAQAPTIPNKDLQIATAVMAAGEEDRAREGPAPGQPDQEGEAPEAEQRGVEINILMNGDRTVAAVT